MENTLTEVQVSTEELLQQLQVDATVAVSEHEGVTLVQIETPEPGILIGYHGRNLEALQLVLGQMLFKKTGSWVRLSVSVGDYRTKREQQLKELALSAASRVEQYQEPVTLHDLTPAERRIVHMALQEHPMVLSESEGEGRNRHLVVKPRT